MGFQAMNKLSVCIVQTGEIYECGPDESLLSGMLRLGRKGIPAGCVNGGCGVCKVRIVEGSVVCLGPVSRAHVCCEEEARSVTLACRVAPESSIRLEVMGCLEKKISRGFAVPASSLPTSVQINNQTGDKSWA